MEQYHKKLQIIRKGNNYTQKDIAKYLGLTQTQFSKIERGESKMNVDDLIALCKLYKVNPDFILGF